MAMGTVPRGGMPTGAGAAIILAPPGARVPRLADGRSGSQRAVRYPKQMARGVAGRRQDLAGTTWCGRETAAGVTATARWLSRAVRSAPPGWLCPCRAASGGSWFRPW
jgi:hypothetical protein